MNEKEATAPLNYIYFGFLFVILTALHIYHVVLIGASSSFAQEIYISIAVLESFVEVFIAAQISVFLITRRMKILHWVYLCILTVLFFLRFIDFALVRLMDVSAWRWMELIVQETFSNFIEMLYATNVKLIVWFMSFLLAIGLIAFSCLLFYLSDKICRKKPCFLSLKKTMSFCLLFFIMIGVSDVLLYLGESSDSSLVYSKAIPWKRTLLDPKQEIIEVQGYLKDPQSSVLQLDQMDSNLFSLERKPDLFLFIVESLRDDFLTEAVTPNLACFRKENYQFSRALSNATGTQLSWFSLFYSMYPFYWTKYQPKYWNQGGMPLTLLKKMGYQINVYASSRLNYYSMDESLFGKKGSLVDHLYEFRPDESLTTSESDFLAVEKLCQDVQNSEQKGGRVFIVFLDSTHFDYSWPQDKASLFLPIEDRIDYLELICNRNSLDIVKNRYRNSLHYVDELFGSFEQTLKAQGMWDDAVVVFAADHGEEFNEYGSIFHASGPSLPQIQIPLYMKLGKDQIASSLDCTRRASQMDIFPTLFHYLAGEDFFAPFFQGESLFGAQKKDYLVGARYNASLAPSKFYIQKEGYRLVLEFNNERDIFHSRFLKVKSLLDEKEEKIPLSYSFIQSHFGEALNQLFSLP